MTDQTLAEIAAQAAHEVLLWVGFGTLVGLAAKAVMPGRDPGGAVATVMMGVAGSVVGCGTMAFFSAEQRITPISPLGFVLATAGAFVLLFFHRLLAGNLFKEGEDRNLARWWPFRQRRRRVLVQELE
jgi:uncharacterized membrane protein YeaQ/YmgE (transglycosylase-associated protein family)